MPKFPETALIRRWLTAKASLITFVRAFTIAVQTTVPKVLPMKKLISAVLLIVAWPLFAGSGFEISGMMGTPSLPWAIALGLAAQAAVYAAGLIASPKSGKVGLIRSIALVFFITQSVALPVFLFALIYGHFTRTDLVDSKLLIWALTQGFSALTLVLKSAKAWNLYIGRGAKLA